MTLVANRFNKYSKRLINASRYMYSTPKYRANIVRVKTKEAAVNARLSIQKTRCESMMSKQKNHRPKSI